jgi:hypothetical protein
MFLLRWYKSLEASVKCNGTISNTFKITRGSRQGSILSPLFFNIFIDDLLVKLENTECGVKIGNDTINNFAYADDVILLSGTVTGLQELIDICNLYAKTWRFTSGHKKSKCMTVGHKIFKEEPVWNLEGVPMLNSDILEILGVSYDSAGNNNSHVEKRVSACRRSMYGLTNAGMSSSGLSSQVKSHLWKTVCAPTLLYGMESVDLNEQNLKKLESIQGSLIKQSLGLSKRNHHSNILHALNVTKCKDFIRNQTIALYNRTFKVPSPMRNVCVQLLARYMATGKVVPGTLICRVV